MLQSAITQTITDTEQVLPNAFRGTSDHKVYLEDCKDDISLEQDHPRKVILDLQSPV